MSGSFTQSIDRSDFGLYNADIERCIVHRLICLREEGLR
jgi:hypothetical protein